MSANIFPLFKTVVALDGLIDDVASQAGFKQDNSGSTWLKDNFPHLMSQLDSLTLDWTLIPKAALRNSTVLRQMVDSYKKNLEYGLIPKSVVDEQAWLHNYENLLEFLDTTVYSALQRMPDDRKEFETDAFAEAFTESDTESGIDD